jgi:hypothetical protein
VGIIVRAHGTTRQPRRFNGAAACLAGSLLLALALAGCGGGGGTPSPPSTPNPVPTLTSISPTSATAGGAAFTLTAYGTNFISSSVVRWNGSSRTTTFVDSTQLTATIPASSIANGGTVNVTVFNPAPGGGSTTPLTFTVENPVPTLLLLTPSGAVAGTSAFTLMLDGSGFVPASVVQWNGSTRTTTFVNGGRVTAAITASDIATPATVPVTVFNPTPVGGTSNAVNFAVAAAQLLVITTTQLPPSSGGKVYDVTLGSVGGTPPVAWTITTGTLPDNLALDSTSGRITGTLGVVSSDTTSTFTVQATDSSATPQQDSKPLSILVTKDALGSNDTCPARATPISNGRIRASISPYGDIDVYSFSGTGGAKVTIEIFAQRLDLDGDPTTRDSHLDSIVELLNSSCALLTYSDDIDPGIIQDSLIQDYILPSNGTYFIRVRDFRGDGRPDLIYELSLSGAN